MKFLKPGPPRIAWISPHANALLEDLRRESVKLGYPTWELEGNQMSTPDDLMRHFDERLEISRWLSPAWGRNWNALFDVLKSLEDYSKSKGYLLIIHSPEKIQSEDFKDLLEILTLSSEYWHVWQNQNVAFKVLFITTEKLGISIGEQLDVAH